MDGLLGLCSEERGKEKNTEVSAFLLPSNYLLVLPIGGTWPTIKLIMSLKVQPVRVSPPGKDEDRSQEHTDTPGMVFGVNKGR